MTKLKIYDTEGFPNPKRVRVAIAEKGLENEVEFVPVDVLRGEHRSETFRRINPSAVVPVLQLEDGAVISECSAITEYLDHLDGAPTLTGSTARARGEIAMLQRKAEADVLETVADYFHHATPGLGPELETDQHPTWGEARRKRAEDGMRRFDDLLADRDYVAGDDFTVADITLAAALDFADIAKIEVPESLGNLHSWRKRVTARPSFA